MGGGRRAKDHGWPRWPGLWQRRRRTPTVLQMEAVECGAAALAIVLGHFGLFVPLEQLRVDCGVSRDGINAANLLRAARRYGMIAKGYSKSPEALADVSRPLIVHWNMDHFLVVEGFGRGKVYLNDPATGPRTVSWSEFDESFSGVALVFQPGPEFRRGGTPPHFFDRVGARVRSSKAAISFVALCGVALILPGFALPVFTRVFIDDYLIRGLDSWVRPLILGMLITALIRAGLTWLQRYYLVRFHLRISIAETSRFMWHLLRLPIEFFGQRYVGDLASRVNLNEQLANIISHQFATVIVDAIAVVLFGALLFFYDVPLTLIGVASLAISLGVLQLVSRHMTDSNRRLETETGKLMGMTFWGLAGVETLKANGADDYYFNKLAGQQAKIVESEQQIARASMYLSLLPTLVGGISNAMILIFGGLRIIDGVMSIGSFVAFQTLMASFSAPVSRLTALGLAIQKFMGSVTRIDDVLDYQVDRQFAAPAIVTSSKGSGGAALEGALDIENLTFGYSRLQPPLLKKFSLHARPGQRVAVVGRSGCGKSTLAKLVTGQYEPWEGSILFDGRPRNEFPRDVLSMFLGYVDQNIFLFEGSVRDNLTLWDATVPDWQITRAAKDAAIHDEIARRPGGYHSKVAEGGANFSGGQRQRLEIARCLVNDPSILVLDEATSDLDSATESTIDANLRRRGCTSLIIAHRLSTIRDCDEIVVLDGGEVTERGTHEDLYAIAGGAYRLMHNA
jgi:NHLM bacteriocin system ABC transporter peptidase/ATP-binding protein